MDYSDCLTLRRRRRTKVKEVVVVVVVVVEEEVVGVVVLQCASFPVHLNLIWAIDRFSAKRESKCHQKVARCFAFVSF